MTAPVMAALQWVGSHSALEPLGPQAARIHGLWRFMWIVAAVVFVAVMAMLVHAAAHRRRGDGEAAKERTMRRAVGVATALTVVVLIVFLALDFGTGRALTMPPQEAVQIRVIGHQWWWDVRYPSPDPSEEVQTANEIHVPVGRPVVIRLESRDVNHSFWPPSLVGKRDLIPGEQSSIWFRADTPGVFRGQCAEFCGHQHAKMGFLVIADPPERYAEWMAAQRDSAHTPSDSSARRGQEVFLASSCVMCHAIKGTPAGSRVGPDLTHLASRRTIAAGTLPNTRGNLAGWIVDPQSIKPGTLMPSNNLSPDDLQALLSYLETLR
jgi:cytochrome c oxidase subunit II